MARAGGAGGAGGGARAEEVAAAGPAPTGAGAGAGAGAEPVLRVEGHWPGEAPGELPAAAPGAPGSAGEVSRAFASPEPPGPGPQTPPPSAPGGFSLEKFRENLDALRIEEVDAERQFRDVEQKERKMFKKGRIRELQDMREQLAETELKLLQQQVELERSEQSVEVLLEELELERKLRGLLTKEKEKAVEEASLALGLCSQGTLLP